MDDAIRNALSWLRRFLAECPYIKFVPVPGASDESKWGDDDAWRPWMPHMATGPTIVLDLSEMTDPRPESLLVSLQVYRVAAGYQTFIRDAHELTATLQNLLQIADEGPTKPRGEVIYEAPTDDLVASRQAGRKLFDWMRLLVSELPVLTPTEPEPPFYEELPTCEETDTREIARFMDKFIEKYPNSPIVGIWMDCGAWLADVDRLVRIGYDLCYNLGVELGDFEGTWDDRTTDRIVVVHSTPHAGPDVLDDWPEHTEPTVNLRIGSGEAARELTLPLSALDAVEPSPEAPAEAKPAPASISAEPALEPEPEPAPRPARSAKRWLALGLASGVAAAALAFVLWPEPSSQPPIAEPLPLTDWDFSICKRESRSIPSRPAAAVETPHRRKASTVQFVKDTDTVIVKRKNKPNLRITIVEEKDTDKPTAAPGERTHEVDWADMGEMGMEVGIEDGTMRFALEGEE